MNYKLGLEKIMSKTIPKDSVALGPKHCFLLRKLF